MPVELILDPPVQGRNGDRAPLNNMRNVAQGSGIEDFIDEFPPVRTSRGLRRTRVNSAGIGSGAAALDFEVDVLVTRFLCTHADLARYPPGQKALLRKCQQVLIIQLSAAAVCHAAAVAEVACDPAAQLVRA